jgi:hypothetical protein
MAQSSVRTNRRVRALIEVARGYLYKIMQHGDNHVIYRFKEKYHLSDQDPRHWDAQRLRRIGAKSRPKAIATIVRDPDRIPERGVLIHWHDGPRPSND